MNRVFKKIIEMLDFSGTPATGDALVHNGTLFVPARMSHPGLVSGETYAPAPLTGAFGGAAPTTSTLIAYPIFVPHPCTIATLTFTQNSNGSAGKLHRMGLYSNSGGIPSALLSDGGSVAADTGSSVAKSVTITYAITAPGWYWTAMTTDTSGNIWIPSGSISLYSSIPASTITAKPAYCQTAAAAPGSSLPNPFGAGAFFAIANKPAVSFTVA